MNPYIPINFYGGQPFTARIWNRNLEVIQDVLNTFKGDLFKKQALTQDKFEATLLERTEVSWQGGASKVVEHNEFGDISFFTVGGLTSSKIFMDANNFMEADLAALKFRFFISGLEVVTISSSGWS